MKQSFDQTIADLLEIEQHCVRFEEALHNGNGLKIEDILAEYKEPLRTKLLWELLRLEIEYSANPDKQAYHDRFPDDTKLVDEVMELSLSVDQSSTPKLPCTLGNFELVEEIARGGMGVVYRANQLVPKRQVAIKMMLGEHMATAAAVRRFQIESEAAASLDHPNIVPVYEVGKIDGQHFFSMKLVEGTDLAAATEKFSVSNDDVKAARGQQQKIANLMLQVCEALSYAHEHGVLHRDVKPSNILVDTSETAYLTDFGIAKLTDTKRSRLTLTSSFVGSPSYMAPEQLDGSGEISSATDVYGVGAVLYELLTGKPPLEGDTIVEVIRKVVDEDPTPPRRRNSLIDVDLETIALRCLEKDPKRRFRSAGEAADEFRLFRQGMPINARPVSHLEYVRRLCQRNPIVSSLLMALVIVTVLGLAGIVWKWRDAEVARVHADAQRDAARWAAYRANMASAASGLELNQAGATQVALDAAPEEHRNWEWHYCRSRVLRPTQVLASAAAFARTVEMSFGSGQQLLQLSQNATIGDYGSLVANLWDLESETYQHYDGIVSSDLSTFARTENGLIVIGKVGADARIELPATQTRLLGFSPDGCKLATLENDNRIFVWDTSNGAELFTVSDSFTQLRWLPFNPSSDRLLAIEKSNPLQVILLDGNTGKVVKAIDCAEGAFRMAFSPDGRYLATAGMFPHNSVVLWDGRTGELIQNLGSHANYVEDLKFSHDSKLLASSSYDRTTVIWDVDQLFKRSTLQGHNGVVRATAFSPNDQFLATASNDRTVRMWDVESGETLAVFSGHKTAVSSVAFDGTGESLASVDERGTVYRWDTKRAIRDIMRGHSSYIYDLSIHPDGAQIATAAWDKTVRVWDIDSRTTVRTLELPEQYVRGTTYSSDGRHIAAATHESLRWWDLQSEDPPKTVGIMSRSFFVVRPSFSDRLERLATPNGSSVDILNVKTGEHISTLTGSGEHQIIEALYSSDEKFLAADDGNVINLWDAESHTLQGVLRGHTAAVRAIEFGPTMGELVSSALDHTVRFWDLSTHECLVEISVPSVVYAIAFHPGGDRIALGADDGTVRLLDLATREEVMVLRGHRQFVLGLKFSPDGSKLISGSGDATIRIWDANPTDR